MTSENASDVVYRIARTSDAAVLSLLATQVFLDTYATGGISPHLAREVREQLSLDRISDRLADAATTFLVAERGDCLIELAQSTRQSGHPLVGADRAVELNRLFVQRPYQGRGIGGDLLGKIETLSRQDGADKLWMTAWTGNQRAQAFYSKHGYVDLGTTHYVFEGVTYEDRVFAKSLS